jgi:hypothetical protein
VISADFRPTKLAMPPLVWFPAAIGTEHGMIQRRVTDFGLLGQEISRFSKQRTLRVEHRPDDPWVEVREAGRGVEGHQLTPVSRGTADDRMQEQGKLRVVGTPEPGGIGVAERADQQFEAGSAAQRGLPGSRPPMTDMAEPHNSSLRRSLAPNRPGRAPAG